MSDSTLPQLVNTRKAVGREARYTGALGASQLPDFEDVIEPGVASVNAQVVFGRDDEGRSIVEVGLRAQVRLECQRCLEWFSREVHSHSRLALVLNDDQARSLPADYEPLISGDETDLWAVVAEELALALPVVAYHPAGECVSHPGASGRAADASDASGSGKEETEVGRDRPNPFDVLSVLLDKPAADANKEE